MRVNPQVMSISVLIFAVISFKPVTYAILSCMYHVMKSFSYLGYWDSALWIESREL